MLYNFRRAIRSEKGISLLEMAIAVLVMGLTILVSLNVFKVVSRGIYVSKNSLRADNLISSKVDDLKAAAASASYGATWVNLTSNALVTTYGSLTVTTIDAKSFTWVVSTSWVTETAGVGSAITTTLNVTNMARFQGWAGWSDIYGPRQLTKTGYATNYRQ